MQVRKHYTQMTATETEAVRARIPWRYHYTEHLLDRLAEKRISTADVDRAIASGKIIEVSKDDHDDLRVLLRYDAGQQATCAVVSIRRCAVVTAWSNRHGDNHATLDTSLYQWRVNLVQEVL